MSRPSFYHHLHPPTIPAKQARFRYTLGLGGMSVFLLLVVLLSGALLLFYYTPTADQANASLQLIADHVPLGWLVRNLHYWSSQALVVTAGLHLLRVALTGGYRPPRAFNWLLGLALLAFVLALDFTGYVLRWDTLTGWALLVGTNLLKAIPLIGKGLYRIAVGGEAIGPATALRVYGWHILGLFIPAAVFAFWHLFRVRRDGGIGHPKPMPGKRPARIDRNALVRTEVFAALLGGAALILLSVLIDPALGPPLDLGAPPASAHAPWFLLWVQELLRLGDPLLFGILLPLAIAIFVAVMPYWVDSHGEAGGWFPRDGRRAQVILLALTLGWMLLTVVGALR